MHTRDSISHWACEQQLNRHGGDASCCACTRHDCPDQPEDKLLKKSLNLHPYEKESCEA